MAFILSACCASFHRQQKGLDILAFLKNFCALFPLRSKFPLKHIYVLGTICVNLVQNGEKRMIIQKELAVFFK